VVVGPEAPLVAGLADDLTSAGDAGHHPEASAVQTHQLCIIANSSVTWAHLQASPPGAPAPRLPSWRDPRLS
jgi:hypothetical protein